MFVYAYPGVVINLGFSARTRQKGLWDAPRLGPFYRRPDTICNAVRGGGGGGAQRARIYILLTGVFTLGGSGRAHDNGGIFCVRRKALFGGGGGRGERVTLLSAGPMFVL